MARYAKDFPMTGTPEQMYGALRNYLLSEGYEETQYKGDNVLKKGNGWVSGPTIFKISFFGNFMRVESWMAFALLPGVFVGEMGPEGFMGWAVKAPWKDRLAQIERMFAPVGYYAAAGATPAAYQQPAAPVQNAAYPQPAAPVQNAAYPQPAAPVQPASGGFCTNCGARLTPGTAFCGNCGAKV